MTKLEFRGYDRFSKKMYYFKGIFNKQSVRDIEISQYINMLDVNGSKLYTGDIIFSDNHNPSYYVINLVDGSYCCGHSSLSGFHLDIGHFYTSKGCMLKKVGNIYENPELLDKI